MCQSCAARLHTGSSPCAVITSSSASSFRRACLTPISHVELLPLPIGYEQNTEHRAPNTEHRTQSTEHRTQNTEHRTQNTEHRTQGRADPTPTPPTPSGKRGGLAQNGEVCAVAASVAKFVSCCMPWTPGHYCDELSYLTVTCSMAHGILKVFVQDDVFPLRQTQVFFFWWAVCQTQAGGGGDSLVTRHM